MAKQERNKVESFRKLATTRTKNAIKNIRLLGNLANKANYEYTPEQSKKIIRTLKAEVKALEQEFASGGKKKDEIEFEL